MKKILVLLLIFFVGNQCKISAQSKEELKKEIIKELLEENPSLVKKDKKQWISFGGKSTFRLAEFDWQQERMKADGTEYSDGTRYWSRMSLYLHADVQLMKNLKIFGQIRTGNKQYSYITFGGNKDERFNVILSQLFVEWSKNGFIAKLGRQGAGSVWKNQKGAQFDIPTHDGLSLSKDFNIGNIILTPKLAFFDEKYRNNSSLSDHGKIYGGSLLLKEKRKNFAWHFQTGLILADKLPNRYENDIAENDADGVRYHDGDLADKYKLWVSQAKLTFPQLSNLSFTADVYHNFQNYDANPQSHLIQGTATKTAPDFTNENMGYIGTVSIGDYGVNKSLYAAASYFHIEKYAAMDYFAQYDCARWASSNIKGIELTLGYRLNKHIAFKTRFFNTKEIEGYNAVNTDYKRSANRIRFDMNINF